MNKLKVGYASVNINPMLGIGVRGYYVPRYASGFLDDLEASALALECDGKRILLISVDACGMSKERADWFRARIESATGVPAARIFLTCTHTHTGPLNDPEESFPSDEDKILRYREFLGERLEDVCRLALADVRPARMGFITGWAPERVAYIRLYMMKDGTTMTCPTINDPNIDHPLGELDQRVHVLRFEREGARGIVLMNYGVHADTVNGDMISADWPGWTRKTIETVLGDKCMCIVGAEGDVGSTHVFPSGGDMNDTEISFDNEMKSPGMARFVGRALAGTILQVYDKAEFVDVDTIDIIEKTVKVAANRPSPEELPLARKYHDLHLAGRDDEIPYKAMELTTVVAEAARMCQLENGPDEFALTMTGLRIGDVAFVGIPGEPFTDLGVQIKDTEGWSMIMPCCLTNGDEGYFPTKEAFEVGGYEARSSRYKADVAEAIVAGGKAILKELKG